MGYILTLPATSTADPSLTAFHHRLSLEYATARTNYGISLSEPMVLDLCAKAAEACKCRKAEFRANKPTKTTTIKFTGQNGSSITVVVSPDKYGDGKANRRPCPSCGVTYDGKTDLGGLNWTNAHNVINHGKMGAALKQAFADALQKGSTPDARLAAPTPTREVQEVITLVVGRAEGYKGPAVAFGAGQQCPVCEKIHDSDSLLQRHERSKLHKGAYNYRSIKIEGNDYVRGNECIVGLQFGATRAVPEGDLVRLKAYTSSMAGKIANEVIETLQEIYDKQERKYDQSLVTDLLLAIDRLTWAVRKRLIEASVEPIGVQKIDRQQVVLAAPVIPDAALIPPLAVPPVPTTVAPTPVAPTLATPSVDTPWVPRTPAANDFKSWNMYIGSLRQRLRRAPYAAQGLESMKRVRGYDASLLPDLARQPDDRERLAYMLEQFWKTFKDKKMPEPVFRELTQSLSRIGFDRAPGQQMNRTKVELGSTSRLTGRNQPT
jgi:hypothetical protein